MFNPERDASPNRQALGSGHVLRARFETEVSSQQVPVQNCTAQNVREPEESTAAQVRERWASMQIQAQMEEFEFEQSDDDNAQKKTEPLELDEIAVAERVRKLHRLFFTTM
tara:strand:- start:300 stop:632 length:333 start_codon:yes stop_codon:yes gene_type:complete